jgi:hypothetical protein
MATRKRSKREENAFKWRALAAFVKYARPGDLHASVDDLRVVVEEVGEKAYVVLTSGSKQLAVFRVRPGPDGQLKRLRRPPRELRGEED